jgi:hypothetical protein
MSLSFGLKVRTVLSLRVCIVVFRGLRLPVTAAGVLADEPRRAKSAHQRNAACMPVAHDAHAAYSD